MMSESPIQTHRFHSNDPDEVSDFLVATYTENRFRACHASNRDVTVSGQQWNGLAVYDGNFEIPFHFQSGGPRPNYLFSSCINGGSTYSSGNSVAQCAIGDVMPVSSASDATCLSRPEGLHHIAVILDVTEVNEFVGHWLGHPLDELIQFDLSPLAKDLATQWNASADCLRRMMLMSPSPDIAIRSLYEHMLKLVVTGHKNNYSDVVLSDRHAPEHLARTAVATIEADPTRWATLSTVAYALGCATNTLENGIRRLTGKHSRDIILDARLRAVHRALAVDIGTGFVGVLRAYGFAPSLRFVRLYHRRFGEPPSATYRRNPSAKDVSRNIRERPDILYETSINRWIDASLGKSISLADIARYTGLSEHATIAAFKERFSRTPMQYVIERRLERARWLLCHTSTSILSIALDCGFGSQSYLTTQIKRYYGVTPRQLRLSGHVPAGDDDSR
ncbi:helix-turn-helix transcriptional regulator [Burkholderia cepacia]|uniref:helix-turn-helix transcriptional regulator n=1 Tax=Burkholderia cepacia TaxID=292 RepID=UPI001CF505A9|nr:helix-turn-helix domain-containing protein [Burkholderia cepacia]MCA7893686.1 helix-turn-helix domain-containing protein [Burkholderia cepacia]